MTNRRVAAVITDLDGTLWDHQGNMASSTRQALSRLAALDIPVVAASARGRWSISQYFDRHAIRLPVVMINGALSFLRHDDSTPITKAPLERFTAQCVVDVMQASGVAPCLFLEQDELDVVITRRASSSSCYLEALRDRVALVPSLHEIVLAHDVYGISVVGGLSRKTAVEVAAMVERVPAARVRIMPDHRFGGWTVDTVAAGVSKWTAATGVCQALGVNPQDAIAVGDGDNDIELFTNATFAVAMPSSTPSLIEVADVQLAEDGHGWADILNYVT